VVSSASAAIPCGSAGLHAAQNHSPSGTGSPGSSSNSASQPSHTIVVTISSGSAAAAAAASIASSETPPPLVLLPPAPPNARAYSTAASTAVSKVPMETLLSPALYCARKRPEASSRTPL